MFGHLRRRDSELVRGSRFPLEFVDDHLHLDFVEFPRAKFRRQRDCDERTQFIPKRLCGKELVLSKRFCLLLINRITVRYFGSIKLPTVAFRLVYLIVSLERVCIRVFSPICCQILILFFRFLVSIGTNAMAV
jgi:hypothetical protein